MNLLNSVPAVVAMLLGAGWSDVSVSQPKTHSSGDIARDVQEIQNLMGRRMFYHSIGRNDLELTLWATRHDIRWGQNQGCWVGMASYRNYYGTINDQMRAASLKQMSGQNPAIQNSPTNLGVGNNAIHTLTTPIIEIAGDGQTAKGVWYTPGVILSTQDAKTPTASWIWERYGGDFIKEDGRWTIWHLQVNTDFMNAMGKPLQVQMEDVAAMGKEGAAAGPPPPGPAGGNIKIPKPDIAKKQYQEFGATRVPVLVPRLPEPYETMKDTFEYADCNGK
jgi:hypothetical protein